MRKTIHSPYIVNIDLSKEPNQTRKDETEIVTIQKQPCNTRYTKNKISEYDEMCFLPSSRRKNYDRLASVRIIKRNMVYASNLPDFMSNQKLLSSTKFFGMFGAPIKVILCSKSNYSKNGLTAYLTYQTEVEAANIIVTFDGYRISSRILKLTFGTVRYCQHYLIGKKCVHSGKCNYNHSPALMKDIIYEEDLNDQVIFENQKNQAIKIATVTNKIVEGKENINTNSSYEEKAGGCVNRNKRASLSSSISSFYSLNKSKNIKRDGLKSESLRGLFKDEELKKEFINRKEDIKGSSQLLDIHVEQREKYSESFTVVSTPFKNVREMIEGNSKSKEPQETMTTKKVSIKEFMKREGFEHEVQPSLCLSMNLQSQFQNNKPSSFIEKAGHIEEKSSSIQEIIKHNEKENAQIVDKLRNNSQTYSVSYFKNNSNHLGKLDHTKEDCNTISCSNFNTIDSNSDTEEKTFILNPTYKEKHEEEQIENDLLNIISEPNEYPMVNILEVGERKNKVLFKPAKKSRFSFACENNHSRAYITKRITDKVHENCPSTITDPKLSKILESQFQYYLFDLIVNKGS